MRFFCKHTAVCFLLWLMASFIVLIPSQAQQVIEVATGSGDPGYFPNNRNSEHVIREILLQYIKDGYPFATFDTTRTIQDTLSLTLYKGSAYQWQFPEPWTTQSFEPYLAKLGNEGYPFATVAFDSLAIDGAEVVAIPRLLTGPKIVFDTLSLSGTDKVSVRYVHALLGFKPGDLYQERKYESITQRLNVQSLVKLSEPPDVGFSNGKAIVYLKTKSIKSDQVEGIFGFLPKAEGGSTVTGYLKLDLNNLFQSGKSLFLDWNRFSPESQSLDLRYGHPFLLGSRVSVAFNLSILRQDSLFIKRRFGLDLQVPIASSLQVGLRLQTSASDIQASEPDISNGLDYRLTEYRPFLRWGNIREVAAYGRTFGLDFSVGVADKKFRRNTLFPEAIYDTLQFRTTNVQVDFMSQFQLPVFKQGAVYSKFEIVLLQGNQLVRNEFYRVGGLRSLRGFNENDFFVSGLFKWQFEYRQYVAQQSYLLAFYDVAAIDQFDSSFKEAIFLNAFGGGIALDTNNGNFRLIFALGSSKASPIDFRNTKIHFGYSIRF
ncbi:MAG: hypothetical protein R8G66_28365 [Cytophagales bacterium]|nr:hypothetical protein [Cytophagales bacterium]